MPTSIILPSNLKLANFTTANLITYPAMFITLLPAYGRDYKSKKAILSDLNSDKDFLLSDVTRSGYINRPQLIEENFREVIVRYDGHRKVTSVKLTSSGEFK